MSHEFFLFVYMPASWIVSGWAACVLALPPVLAGRVEEDAFPMAWFYVWRLLMIPALLFFLLTLNFLSAFMVIVAIAVQLVAFLAAVSIIFVYLEVPGYQYKEWAALLPTTPMEANVRAAIRKEFKKKHLN